MAKSRFNSKYKNIKYYKRIFFFAYFRKKSNRFKKPRNNRSAYSAIKKTNKLKQSYKNNKKIKEKYINYQNKKRKIVPLFKNNDKVYLLTKKLKIRKKNKKLNYFNTRPFFLNTRKKTITYKFELYIYAKIDSIFDLYYHT